MNYGAAEFVSEFGLGHEQREACEHYAALLLETQAHTNLIGPATVQELWLRHFGDSAQILAHGKPYGHWLDLGSGAGFPGLVLAILGARVELVESRLKKAAFLVRVVEALGLQSNVRVHAARIEAIEAVLVDCITARAVAPVAQLFDWGLPFAAQSTRWVLPKGRTVESELSEARRRFMFNVELRPSRTSADGQIVCATAVTPMFHVEHRPKRRG